MQSANDIAPARKDPKARTEDSRTPTRYAAEGKPAAASEKSDLPTWDEV